NTGRESTSTLTRHIRDDAACFKPPRREKPNRHGGIYVRTRNISNRINHRQYNEAKSKCHSDMRNRAAGYAIDHDRAGAGKNEAESSQKFCDYSFQRTGAVVQCSSQKASIFASI